MKVSKRRAVWIYLAMAAAVTVAGVAANGQSGTESLTVQQRGNSGQVATLQQQLEKGLRVRFPHEFEYVEKVAKLVEQRKLPLKLVQGSFAYARKKGSRRYPFVYFKRVLELRAKRLGIRI